MVDTHAHLDAPELADDIEHVLDRFRAAGGTHIVNCSADIMSCHKAIALSLTYPEIGPALGLHPELTIPGAELYTKAISAKWIHEQIEAIAELIAHYPQVVAVGECGLEYRFMKRERLPGRETLFKQQHDIFVSCIHVAVEHTLPIIVHCRDEDGDKQAEAECLELLVKEGGVGVKGVFHSYTGSLEYLEDILALGFYVSFNGIVTYKNAEHVREILDKVPLERLLIETDAPWLVPNRRRSAGIRVCEPLFGDEVAEVIAKRKGISSELVWRTVEENAEKLFQFQRI